MWLVLRILTLASVYLWRFFWRQQGYDTAEDYRGVLRVRKVHTNKGRFVRAFHGLALEGPLRFQFTTESGWDAFFKGLGLAVEQQTGVPAFDQRVYITCDQPTLGEALRDEAPARAALLSLFDQGVTRVFADGAHVWAETKNEDQQASALLSDLYRLRETLVKIDPTTHRSRRDAFFWKAVAVESLIWSIAAYGIPGFIEMAWRRHTVYLEVWPVFQTGFLWSLGVLAGLLGLIVLFLRGSSRGHRIIAESVVVLLIGVPLSTVQAVSDVNIQLDSSVPTVAESRVSSKSTEIRRRRRGGTTTRYFLHLSAPPGDPHALRGKIEVEWSLYQATPDRSLVVATLREGRLGFRWIEAIRPKR